MYQDSGIGYNPTLIARRLKQEKIRAAQKVLDKAEADAMNILRSRFAPDWVRDIIKDAADDEGAHIGEVIGESRRSEVVRARHRAMYLIKATKPGLSFPQIAKWFDRDHTSTIYAVAQYGRRNGLQAFTSSVGKR